MTKNNATVTAVLHHLGIPIPALSVRPPCRMERHGNVILDVGHNPDGIQRLLQSLPWSRFCVVCGFSADKDIMSCLQLLSPAATHIHLVAANHKRAMPINILKEQAEAVLPKGTFQRTPQ